MKQQQEERIAHWSRQKEQTAGYWHVRLLLVLFGFFPVVVMRIIAFPVGFFYFIFSKESKRASRRFLRQAASQVEKPETAKKCRSAFGALRHFIAFSLTVVEKIDAWGGRFPFRRIQFQDDDIGELIEGLERGKGAFLICSHLGNAELLRGLASFNRTGVSRDVPVTSIVDFAVTANFNRMLKKLNKKSMAGLISAREINPGTAVLLEEKLAAGELVVIAGDRTSGKEDGNTIMIPFLGKEAPFPRGPFYLASLMNAPVYFVFALRLKDLALKKAYTMHVHKSGVSFDCPRKERGRRAEDLARAFAGTLERYCRRHPFQWYNFYDFWPGEV
jgi:predicted LPLAT superfamily acyltransferase